MATCKYPGLERWKGKVAIVTGASAGLGYVLTKQLAQAGIVVVGCARNIEKIEELSKELSASGGKVVPMKCDVSKEEDILAMMSAIKLNYGGADICINNAGLAHKSSIIDGTTADWKNMMDVNVIGLCMMTREFVKQMRERKVDDGHIFFMNSVGGQRVSSASVAHFYSATKHTVTALAEAVRKELREIKSNIKITDISPGVIYTEFTTRMFKLKDSASEATKKGMYGSLAYEILQPEDVADCLIYALATPPRVQIHEIIVRPTNQPE